MFVAVSIVVPIIANWMRAYMIVMLGHLSEQPARRRRRPPDLRLGVLRHRHGADVLDRLAVARGPRSTDADAAAAPRRRGQPAAAAALAVARRRWRPRRSALATVWPLFDIAADADSADGAGAPRARSACRTGARGADRVRRQISSRGSTRHRPTLHGNTIARRRARSASTSPTTATRPRRKVVSSENVLVGTDDPAGT